MTSRALSPWNQHEPDGVVPFYLPKPLLVISKNFFQVETAQSGLKDRDTAPIPETFDNQAAYGDVNARAKALAEDAGEAAPEASGEDPTLPAFLRGLGEEEVDDLLTPRTFFTYQIVFVPDLTQKYGLLIRGGPGEMRAAMNLVNGWQYTGLGPYYLKDSSTAQNILSRGIQASLISTGVADVISNLAGVGDAASSGAGVSQSALQNIQTKMEAAQRNAAAADLPPHSCTIPEYAQIFVFEPYLTLEGTMEWRPLEEKTFGRFFLGADAKDSNNVAVGCDVEHYGFTRNPRRDATSSTSAAIGPLLEAPLPTISTEPVNLERADLGLKPIPAHAPTVMWVE